MYQILADFDTGKGTGHHLAGIPCSPLGGAA
jgi:hypothetical protein